MEQMPNNSTRLYTVLRPGFWRLCEVAGGDLAVRDPRYIDPFFNHPPIWAMNAILWQSQTGRVWAIG